MKSENKQWHELYGHLSKEAVDKLSEEDKLQAFHNFLEMKPTAAGKFITQVIVKALGPDFLLFLAMEIINSKADTPGIPDDLTDEDNAYIMLGGVASLLDTFASDTNILCNYVSDYIQENGYNQDVINRVTKAMTLNDNGPTFMDKLKEVLDEEHEKDRPIRDPKTGRFIKRS